MTSEYGTVITTQGAAILADCILNGKKLSIAAAGVGDGGGAPTTPLPDQTALVNERWRGAIARASVHPTTPNMLDVKIVIGDNVGGFTIREMGLYNDTGTLIAVCNTPDTAKVTASGGVSGKLTMIMHLAVVDAAVIDLSIHSDLDTFKRKLTIPAAGWAVNQMTGDEDCGGLYLDIPQDDMDASMIPSLYIHPAGLSIARRCGLSSSVRTLDGALRLYSESAPTEAMTATLILLDAKAIAGDANRVPAATPTTLGTIKPGNGLTVASDGTLSVNVSSASEMNQLLEEVFGA